MQTTMVRPTFASGNAAEFPADIGAVGEAPRQILVDGPSRRTATVVADVVDGVVGV